MAETAPANIYQKLAKIRKQVEVIQRNKSGYGYKYVSEDEILAKVSAFMGKYNLSLIPSVIHNSAVIDSVHLQLCCDCFDELVEDCKINPIEETEY